jgi:hypothetical protein
MAPMSSGRSREMPGRVRAEVDYFGLLPIRCFHARPPWRILAVNAQQAHGMDASPRSRWQRCRRAAIAAGVAVLAIGALLLWGPVGLGAGPLFVGEFDAGGGPDSGAPAVAVVIPVHDSSHDPAVIDSIRLVGRTSYPGPHVIRREAWSVANCTGAWPVPAGARSFVAKDCGGKGLGPLIGHAFGFTKPVSPGYGAAFELSPPRAGSCWVLTDVVVHYHVGTKHYSTTDPDDLAVCAGNKPSRQINAAMSAAQSAEPR